MTASVCIITILVVLFTMAVLYPKVWSMFLPPALLPISCFLFMLYLLYMCMLSNVDPTVGINEYVQDRISRSCGGFNNFIKNVDNDRKNLEADELHVKYYGGKFLFVSSRNAPILSRLQFSHDDVIQTSPNIAWNREISICLPRFLEMFFFLLDFYRVIFFYLIVISIILFWNSCKTWLLSNRKTTITVIRILSLVVPCAAGLYYAKNVLPQTEYNVSLNTNFDRGKLFDQKLTDKLNKITHDDVAGSDNYQDLCGQLGIHNIFVATAKSLYIPHIRWNGGLFEYYFFIPDDYPPNRLNQYLSWHKIQDGYWYAKYWHYYIVWLLSKVAIYGLYLTGCILTIYFPISLLKTLFVKSTPALRRSPPGPTTAADS